MSFLVYFIFFDRLIARYPGQKFWRIIRIKRVGPTVWASGRFQLTFAVLATDYTFLGRDLQFATDSALVTLNGRI